MTTVGIIAEYNPFHNGHLHQLAEIKRKIPDAATIAVISGSITQRGEIAVFDKWTRAETAVSSGIDLIVELPAVFAVRSAEHFARGGITLLNRLGIVNHLAFSAEHPDREKLSALALAGNSSAVQKNLAFLLQQGYSYAAAAGRSLAKETDIEESLLRSPNNLLAIEYLKALLQTNSSIQPLILQRTNAAHHSLELTGKISSASAIRNCLYNSSLSMKSRLHSLRSALPPKSFQNAEHHLQIGAFPIPEALFLPLIAKLQFTSDADLEKIYGNEPGLHYRLRHLSQEANTLEELLSLTQCKRYQKSRLRRLFIAVLLGITKDAILRFDAEGPSYARVLAFNDRGRALLRKIKHTTDFPILHRIAKTLPAAARFKNLAVKEHMLAIDTFATDLQSLTYPTCQSPAKDFILSPRYVKSVKSST